MVDRSVESRGAGSAPWHWLLVTAVTALVLHTGWAWVSAERQPRFDETAYVEHARRLGRGDGFVDAQGHPASYWPVGYPAALGLVYAVAGEGYAPAAVLNVLCGTLTAVLTFLLATSLVGPAAGAMAGMVVARLRAGLAASERSASVMAFRWAAVMGLFAVLMLANLYFKSIESA